MNDFQKNALLLGIGIIAGFIIALFVLDDSEREQQMQRRLDAAEQRIRICPN
jgi:sensor c-di-GMP phosphodiesterase-like protein